MFNAVETAGALIVSLTYSLDLFTSATVGRALQHLGNLLRAAAAAPGTRVDDLPMISAHRSVSTSRSANNDASRAVK